MNVLQLSAARGAVATLLRAELTAGLEVHSFGPAEEIPYDAGESWEALLGRLPDDWQPDVVLSWSPEYHPWPIVGQCPLPLVAVVGDWNLNFSVLRAVLGQCDYIFTDRACANRLRACGYENVEYWPMFSYNPAVHRPYPDANVLFDAVFVGNLNHQVQRQRARLLARLAKLSERYRVGILTGIYGEDYGRLLASSRIVVNHSIGGAMNMRAYEAPACGALLFLERENLEVREYLQDGVECVLYGEDDFEMLLERYLADEPLRAKVAAAGHARIGPEDYATHSKRLLCRFAELDWTGLRGHRARWAALPPAEQHYWNGRWLQQTAVAWQGARDALAAAARLAPEEPEYANAAATTEALLAVALRRAVQNEAAQQCAAAAERAWATLLRRCPEHALAWANLGTLRLTLGQTAAGEQALDEALRLLCDEPERALVREGCRFAPDYDTLRVEWERACATHAGHPPETLAALRALLRWECAQRLGKLALDQGLADRARSLFAVAVAARPDLEAGYAGLGAAWQQLGDAAAASDAYAEALERQPWDFETRQRLALLLYLSGEEDRCAAVCRDGLALARACPMYDTAARALEGLLRQLGPLDGGARSPGAEADPQRPGDSAAA